MRVFLIIFSFINAFLYFMFYAFFDSIMNLTGGLSISPDIVAFLKLLILIVFGFLIGLVVSLLLKLNIEKSFFDYKTALIAGIFPFIFLILSIGSITNFIVANILQSNRQLTELLFYFLSRQIIFSLWFGFAIGVSVRIAFKKKIKHEITYNLNNIE